MGLSFIGNPYEQEEDGLEDELEWSEVEDNIQNIFVVRIPIEDERNDADVEVDFLSPSIPASTSDSDEDFIPASDTEEDEESAWEEYVSTEDDEEVSVGTTVSFSEDEEAPESYESFLASVFEKFDTTNVEDETD